MKSINSNFKFSTLYELPMMVEVNIFEIFLFYKILVSSKRVLWPSLLNTFVKKYFVISFFDIYKVNWFMNYFTF